MADAQGLGLLPTWADGIFMSNSGELALGLEKDLGFSRLLFDFGLGSGGPKNLQRNAACPSPPLTPSWWDLGAC